MPVFLCRWQNGDFSVVKAVDKDEAIEFLDEVANSEDCKITAIRDFMVHFHLNDAGEFDLETFGGATTDHIMRLGYPVLNKAFLDGANYKGAAVTEDGQENILHAVKTERERLWPKKKIKSKNEPETQFGIRLKAETDMPSKMIDRLVKQVATEKLKKFKGKGKPN